MAHWGYGCCGPFKASTDSSTWQTSPQAATVEEEVSTQDSSSDTLTLCSDIPDLSLFFGRKEHNLK
jgi:hypothetical protein